jgi:hypothetical protein
MGMAKCRGCGKAILWATDPIAGTNIPLDTTPPVYEVTQTQENEFALARANQKFNTDQAMYFVSHFATCPQANHFSRHQRAMPEKDLKAEASGENAGRISSDAQLLLMWPVGALGFFGALLSGMFWPIGILFVAYLVMLWRYVRRENKRKGRGVKNDRNFEVV